MKWTRRGGRGERRKRSQGRGAEEKKNQGNGKGNPFMVGKAKKTCTTHRRRPQVSDDAGQGRRLAPHHRYVRGRLWVDEGLKHGAKQMRRRFQHLNKATSLVPPAAPSRLPPSLPHPPPAAARWRTGPRCKRWRWCGPPEGEA